MTLDERKTLTKISTRNLSQQFPQTSAHFGHDKIRNKKTGKEHLASIPEEASCIKPGKASCIIRNKKTGKEHLASIPEEASCIKPGKASCIIGGESQGIRISSRNNKTQQTEMRENSTEIPRLVSYQTLHYLLVSKLYIIFFIYATLET